MPPLSFSDAAIAAGGDTPRFADAFRARTTA
jgi:hypothetical protein